jgi:four helix bundle protein
VPSHRELIVWQKAMDLIDRTYELVARLPAGERFGLASQMTRAAVSIPANIAEGHARVGRREFAHFVSIARASLAELETLVEVAIRRGYFSAQGAQEFFTLAGEVGKMLTVLGQRLARGTG